MVAYFPANSTCKRVAKVLLAQEQPMEEKKEPEVVDKKDLDPKLQEQMTDFQKMFEPEELNPELAQHLTNTGGKYDWPMLHHPLVVSVPYHEQMNKIHNNTLRHKKKWLAEQEQAKNWDSAIYTHERPYRLQAFLKYARHMTDKEYWENLASIWIDSEGPGVNKRVWMDLFNSPRTGREFLMDEEERKFYQGLPDVITVYRGCNKKDKTGMSWTLSKDTAKWFSKRLLQQGEVYEAQINKADVYAYFNSRHEQEILLNPKKLQNVHFIKVTTPAAKPGATA